MIQNQTYLNVADNSGAKKIMCIRVLGSGNPSFANIGDKCDLFELNCII